MNGFWTGYRIPTAAHPFDLVAFTDCRTGRPEFDILSKNRSVGFTPSLHSDTVVLDLRLDNHRRTSAVALPGRQFLLKVVMGHNGDALFEVDSGVEPLEVKYIRPLPLLRLREVHDLPLHSTFYQSPGKDKELILRLLDTLKGEFSDSIRVVTLPEGYYRCIPAHLVAPARLGRRLTVNRTTFGYLLCLQAVDDLQLTRLYNWLQTQPSERDDAHTPQAPDTTNGG